MLSRNQASPKIEAASLLQWIVCTHIMYVLYMMHVCLYIFNMPESTSGENSVYCTYCLMPMGECTQNFSSVLSRELTYLQISCYSRHPQQLLREQYWEEWTLLQHIARKHVCSSHTVSLLRYVRMYIHA
jgi:hypothetical protein